MGFETVVTHSWSRYLYVPCHRVMWETKVGQLSEIIWPCSSCQVVLEAEVRRSPEDDLKCPVLKIVLKMV